MGDVPQFSEQALTDLKRVVFELVKRTPDFHGADDNTAIGRQFLEDSLRSLKSSPDPELQTTIKKELSDRGRVWVPRVLQGFSERLEQD